MGTKRTMSVLNICHRPESSLMFFLHILITLQQNNKVLNEANERFPFVQGKTMILP